jgi:hypothetical protein
MDRVAYFDALARQREKQEARDRDEHLIVRGQVDSRQIAERNGFFSALDPSRARLVRRRAEVRIA